MATRQFNINTQPHEAVIGDTTLLFQPEAVGAVFMNAYAGLREAQERVAAAGDKATAEDLESMDKAMRGFVSTFLLPDSQDEFDDMQLPSRILVQLLEYAAELYGGGSQGNARGGSSSGS
jgi:hypothetical protein